MGMGELHPDIKVDILRRTHGVDVVVGKPLVAYRESITQTIEDSYTHKKQSGGSGQYAKIDYIVAPVRRVWFRIRIQGNGWKCPERILASGRERLPG